MRFARFAEHRLHGRLRVRWLGVALQPKPACHEPTLQVVVPTLPAKNTRSMWRTGPDPGFELRFYHHCLGPIAIPPVARECLLDIPLDLLSRRSLSATAMLVEDDDCLAVLVGVRTQAPTGVAAAPGVPPNMAGDVMLNGQDAKALRPIEHRLQRLGHVLIGHQHIQILHAGNLPKNLGSKQQIDVGGALPVPQMGMLVATDDLRLATVFGEAQQFLWLGTGEEDWRVCRDQHLRIVR